MARSVIANRPPLVTSCLLLAAVLWLAPPDRRRELAPMGPRPVVVVQGEPFGDLYIPPAAVDPWSLLGVPDVDPHINLYLHHLPKVRFVPIVPSVDSLVSGFLELLITPSS